MANGETAAAITEKLTRAFAPVMLKVEDESWKHAGHAGARPEGETHFAVTLVSRAFEGLSRVERQRHVYAALSEEMAPERVHALALSVHAPGEAAPEASDPA